MQIELDSLARLAPLRMGRKIILLRLNMDHLCNKMPQLTIGAGTVLALADGDMYKTKI